ncbi:MAG: hypothetical protein ABFD92_16625 [Planctomycetaceae bacterium]|nr:hypothetical protein [Planctomycetaceae bacterium]
MLELMENPAIQFLQCLAAMGALAAMGLLAGACIDAMIRSHSKEEEL